MFDAMECNATSRPRNRKRPRSQWRVLPTVATVVVGLSAHWGCAYPLERRYLRRDFHAFKENQYFERHFDHANEEAGAFADETNSRQVGEPGTSAPSPLTNSSNDGIVTGGPRGTSGPTDSPQPSPSPSITPTSQPTTSTEPTRIPTSPPTDTVAPSPSPSQMPTTKPTTSGPSESPSAGPTTLQPTPWPTPIPTTSRPSDSPSAGPTTLPPTPSPTTTAPSSRPSVSHPSRAPTVVPTATPTSLPTALPSQMPSQRPTTMRPSASPSKSPSNSPTTNPTGAPSRQGSEAPTVSVRPSKAPSAHPTGRPSMRPSSNPTAAPSIRLSLTPSISYSPTPPPAPTHFPSIIPTAFPSDSLSPSGQSSFPIVLRPSRAVPLTPFDLSMQFAEPLSSTQANVVAIELETVLTDYLEQELVTTNFGPGITLERINLNVTAPNVVANDTNATSSLRSRWLQQQALIYKVVGNAQFSSNGSSTLDANTLSATLDSSMTNVLNDPGKQAQLTSFLQTHPNSQVLQSSSSVSAQLQAPPTTGKRRPTILSIVFGFLLVGLAIASLLLYLYVFCKNRRKKAAKKKREREGIYAVPARSRPTPVTPGFLATSGTQSQDESSEDDSSYKGMSDSSSEVGHDAFARELRLAANLDRKAWEEFQYRRKVGLLLDSIGCNSISFCIAIHVFVYIAPGGERHGSWEASQVEWRHLQFTFL